MLDTMKDFYSTECPEITDVLPEFSSMDNRTWVNCINSIAKHKKKASKPQNFLNQFKQFPLKSWPDKMTTSMESYVDKEAPSSTIDFLKGIL